jgi:type II secretory pathway component PulF
MRNARYLLAVLAIVAVCAVPMVTAAAMGLSPGWFIAACIPLILALAAVFHNALRGERRSDRRPLARRRPRRQRGGLFLAIVALPTALLAFVAFFTFGLGMIFAPLAMLIALAYGWLLFAFLHYRFGRQDELLHLIATAVDSGAPLAPALRSYVADRPHGTTREFWVAVGQFIMLPGYYWIWHRRHQFDRKIKKVASLLEQGSSLSEALAAVPGVAGKQTAVAAAVGESTGHLPMCLRHAQQVSLGPVWLEVLPRILYPFTILWFTATILLWWMVFIGPKLTRIFSAFKLPFPSMTANAMFVSEVFLTSYANVLLLLVIVVLTLIFSPAVRWWTPGLGRWYQSQVQGRLFGLLAVIIEAGKPVPEGIEMLVGSGQFSRTVERRLQHAHDRILDGEALAASLHGYGLLSSAMTPLVQTAERVRNLPWVLRELGVVLVDRTIRRMRRGSMLLMPLMVIGVGVLVGYIVISMFVPLVELISALGD